jgi:hypothetical protein
LTAAQATPHKHKRTRKKRYLAIGGGAAAVGLMAAVLAATAGAADVNTIVPTANYPYDCKTGEPGAAWACRTDNHYWTVFRGASLNDKQSLRVAAVLKEQFGPTDLDLNFPDKPDTSGTGETDLIFTEGDVPPGYDGFTWCKDPSGRHECDQHQVRIEGEDFYYGLICHEAGHAVGLVHGDGANPKQSMTGSKMGCMKNPMPRDAVLGSVNKDNINREY